MDHLLSLRASRVPTSLVGKKARHATLIAPYYKEAIARVKTPRKHSRLQKSPHFRSICSLKTGCNTNKKGRDTGCDTKGGGCNTGCETNHWQGRRDTDSEANQEKEVGKQPRSRQNNRLLLRDLNRFSFSGSKGLFLQVWTILKTNEHPFEVK